jgi:transposase-like protein
VESTDLTSASSALLDRVDAQERERRMGQLEPEDRALILRLAAKGNLTQAEIAKAIGCNQSTVSRVLQLLDTRKEARAILESGAARLADTVVKTDDAGVALKALGKIDVVRDDKAEGPQVTVFVGCMPAGSPLFFKGDVLEASCEVTPPRIDGGPEPDHGPKNALAVRRGLAMIGLPDGGRDLTLAAIPPDVMVTNEARAILEAHAADAARNVTPHDR